MHNKTDEQLMLLIQTGNKYAYSILVKRYLPKALSFADKIAREGSEDIVQESLVKVWQKACSFNAEKAVFSTWFFTILKNTSYNYIKKYNYNVHCNIDDFTDSIISQTKPADSKLLEQERNNNLELSLKKLNQREQQVIKLRYFKEHSTKETALIMNSSIKAVETLASRAKQKLRDILS